MQELLKLSSELIKQNLSGQEKELANTLYATALLTAIRNGDIYKRYIMEDGLPGIAVFSGGVEYHCSEYLLKKLSHDSINFTPYEDNSGHFDELLSLFGKYQATETPENKDDKKETKTLQVNITIPQKERTETEVIEIEPEITISEEDQMEYMLDETEYYKTGTWISYMTSAAIFILGFVIFLS